MKMQVIDLMREFIILPEFDKNWSAAGLNDDDLRKFQLYLSRNLESGPVIPGTGGLRKVRWLTSKNGKRAGIRCIYIDFAYYEKIYLLTAYTKSTKEDLTETDKNQMRFLVELLKKELGRK